MTDRGRLRFPMALVVALFATPWSGCSTPGDIGSAADIGRDGHASRDDVVRDARAPEAELGGHDLAVSRAETAAPCPCAVPSRLGACVVPAGSGGGGDPDTPLADSLSVAGAVVASGTGEAPDGCFRFGLAGEGVPLAAPEELDAARWFTLQDLGGKTWTVGLLLGADTPAFVPGQALRIAVARPAGVGAVRTLRVSRPIGRLVAWFGTGDSIADLAPPEEVLLGQGGRHCSGAAPCGVCESYSLDVAADGATVSIAPGETATLSSLRVTNGGLWGAGQGTGECAPLPEPRATVAIVTTSEPSPECAPRPRALWPGPCTVTEEHAGIEQRPFRRYTYDAAGRTIREEWGADVGSPTVQVWTWTYDDSGRLVAEGGAAGPIRAYVYDEAGRHVRTDLFAADGTLAGQTVLSYDDRGRVIRRETDYGLDGVVDSRDTIAYDDALGRATEQQDDDADGVVDRQMSVVRDGEGRVVEESWDELADGVIELRTTKAYYTAGRRTVVEEDMGCCGDGHGGRTCGRPCGRDQEPDIRTVSVVEAGTHTSLSARDGGVHWPPDGVAESEWAHGVVSSRESVEVWRDGSGETVGTTRYTHDSQCDLVMAVDESGTGLGTYSPIQYVRDPDGNLLREVRYSRTTGLPDHTTVYDYSCWPATP